MTVFLVIVQSVVDKSVYSAVVGWGVWWMSVRSAWRWGSVCPLSCSVRDQESGELCVIVGLSASPFSPLIFASFVLGLLLVSHKFSFPVQCIYCFTIALCDF